MIAHILYSARVAAALALTCLVAQAQEAEVVRPDRGIDMARNGSLSSTRAAHLTADDNIGALLRHPALRGYSRLLLPWDGRSYDETLRLRDIGSLLPYHSHVDPGTVVAGLNRLIDDVNGGNPVFYEIYGEAEKRAEPARGPTGLFFFRGKPGARFSVISPGGGFSYVGSVHEGFPYAAEISGKGYNAFVLKYRTGYGGTPATEDLAAAISYIMRNAEALGVDPRGYSLWGSSAGARMAASIGSHGVAAFGGDELPKPAVVVMAYSAHSDISSREPPTFVVVGERDGIAPPSVMERRVAALRRAGTEVDYRVYKSLGHGFGQGIGTDAEGWISDATRFWERFIKKR